MSEEEVTVYEIDGDDGEVCGKRRVGLADFVIPAGSIPQRVTWLRLDLSRAYTCVEEIQIGWFGEGESLDYEMSNNSRYYLEVTLGVKGTTSDQYDRAWERFRKEGIELLCEKCGFSTWGMGMGIADRRGQDLFIIELDGLDYPMWGLFCSVREGDTWSRILEFATGVDRFAATTLKSLITA